MGIPRTFYEQTRRSTGARQPLMTLADLAAETGLSRRSLAGLLATHRIGAPCPAPGVSGIAASRYYPQATLRAWAAAVIPKYKEGRNGLRHQ